MNPLLAMLFDNYINERNHHCPLCAFRSIASKCTRKYKKRWKRYNLGEKNGLNCKSERLFSTNFLCCVTSDEKSLQIDVNLFLKIYSQKRFLNVRILGD